MTQKKNNVIRVILSIILIPLYITCIYLLIFILCNGEKLSDKYEVLIFVACMVIIFSYFISKLFIPKYYKCMCVVRKFISYKELKYMLRGEVFRKINFNVQQNRWKIAKLYSSNSWIFIDGVYIPKNMIVDIIRYSPGITSGCVDIFFLTINGKLIRLGRISLKWLDEFLNILKEEFVELEFSNSLSMAIFQGSILREMKKKLTKDIYTKEKFIEFISRKG